MPRIVRITEVSPRDGLQNEPARVPTDQKAALVRACAASGADEVEITSFVSPKWIPQLGDASELCALLTGDKPEGVVYSALVPNEEGMQRLLEANRAADRAGQETLIDKASVFTAASETFSRKNTNATIAEAIERFHPVRELATAHGLRLRAYISCVIACPFEGPIEPAAVAEVAARLVELGADEIDLGDTIGAGDADTTAAMLEYVRAELGPDWFTPDRLTLHLHDTFARAPDCVRAALDLGLRSFDASAAGLGGCPYAGTRDNPAPGNIATSTLMRTVEQAGYETNLDHPQLMRTETLANTIINEARTA